MPYKTFGFSQEQVMMRDSVLGTLNRVLPEAKILELEADSAYPAEAFQALAEAGWLALPFEERYGGAAASNKDLAVFIEALGYHHAGITSAFMTTVIYGGLHLQFHGADWMKRELLPKVIGGKLRMAVGYSEPSGGSDAAAILTRAKRDGDDYVISGQKVFITNAHVADYLVITAKTDPGAGHKGLSLFLLDTKLPGVTIRNLNPMGRRTSLPNEVFLDEVRVPASHLVGEENRGWPLLMRGLNMERMLLAAASAGQMMKIIEIAKDWATQRKAFGQTITEFQAISHKFADMAMMTETARLHTYSVADRLDAGEDPVLETAIAKTVATEYNMIVADLGVQIMGGAGYMDGRMSQLYRDARVGPIGGGSSEIMRTVIAKRMGVI
ncbi:MAG: acyl-CoA/acyl-ACP dehydrogenase [Alphaproteobacteria bacterium]|nr:acyl-CoA/acyl-ACP dehydrogenase [Alphaproteobacteria bacterium]MCB9930000.1 acyl-CoA/acyl-ACP dehydrogenase [Alphaproteobacteria bacterium]